MHVHAHDGSSKGRVCLLSLKVAISVLHRHFLTNFGACLNNIFIVVVCQPPDPPYRDCEKNYKVCVTLMGHGVAIVQHVA